MKKGLFIILGVLFILPLTANAEEKLGVDINCPAEANAPITCQLIADAPNNNLASVDIIIEKDNDNYDMKVELSSGLQGEWDASINNLSIYGSSSSEGSVLATNGAVLATIKLTAKDGYTVKDGDKINFTLTLSEVSDDNYNNIVPENTKLNSAITVSTEKESEIVAPSQSNNSGSSTVVTSDSRNPRTGVIEISATLITLLIVGGSYLVIRKNKINA